MFFFNERYGRRVALIMAGVIFDIGVILQIASNGNVPVFYVGRIVSGLGIGGSSFVVPQYLSENAPAIARGALIGCVSRDHRFSEDV
jgi:MFS family permease